MSIAMIEFEFLGFLACFLLVVLAAAVALAVAALSRVAGVERELKSLRQRFENAELMRRREAAPERPRVVPVPPPAPPPQPQAAPPVQPAPPPPRVEPAASKPIPVAARSTPATRPQPAPSSARKTPSASLEEKLGARLFVWIGAVALAGAGVFLVKYTIEHSVLSDTMRFALAVGFGIALLGAGVGVFGRVARIGEALSAAGVAVLFAAFWAGVRWYGLVPGWLGFALMAAVTALAVVLSLRQGPFVALLGLVGGFLTPVLVGEGQGQPELLAYLFLLQCGVLAVTRRRSWTALASCTLIGAIVWSAAWMALWYSSDEAVWVGLFLLLSASLYIFAARLNDGAPWGRPQWSDALAWAGALFGLFMLGWLVRAGNFTPLEWSFLTLGGVGCLVLGRLDGRMEPLAWLAVAVNVALVINWALGLPAASTAAFGWTVLAMGAVFAVGAYLCMWWKARSAARWAALCVAVALAYFLLTYWTLDQLQGLALPPGTWGWICAGLATASLAAAGPVYRRRDTLTQGAAALAAFVVAVTAFVSLVWPIELENEWLAVAWAVQIPLLAAAHLKLRLPAVRPIAAVLAAIVLISLFNPGIFSYPIGAHSLLNWLSYGFGVSALAFAGGAWLFLRDDDDWVPRFLEGAAVATTWALLTLLVRQWFHPGNPDSGSYSVAEWAALTNIWLIFGMVLFALVAPSQRRVLIVAGQIILCVAAAQGLMAQGLIASPLFNRASVGAMPVFNLLLWLYGLPMLLLAAAAWLTHRFRQPTDAWLAIASLAFLLLLVTTEIRQAFHGEFIHVAVRSNSEWATFTAAWMFVGVVLIALSRRWPMVRIAGVTVLALGFAQAMFTHVTQFNPLLVAQPVGAALVFNWLLYWYALPAALLAVAVFMLWKLGELPAARFFLVAAILLTLLTVTLQVR